MRFRWPRPSRVYAILDTGYVRRSEWETKCRSLIEGGADIVQLRAKNVNRQERRLLLEAILPLFTESSCPLVINDDWELACEYPGVGVHIGQDDDSVETVRAAIGAERILGLSTHSLDQARAAIDRAGDLNYFAVGPVFATPTKPDYEPVGLELVRRVARLKPPLPWFCIGGVKRTNAPRVIAAGAPALVAVSDLLDTEDTCGAVRELGALFDE